MKFWSGSSILVGQYRNQPMHSVSWIQIPEDQVRLKGLPWLTLLLSSIYTSNDTAISADTKRIRDFHFSAIC